MSDEKVLNENPVVDPPFIKHGYAQTVEPASEADTTEFRLVDAKQIVDGKEVPLDLVIEGESPTVTTEAPKEPPLTDRYVPMHNKVSREVTNDDVPRVAEEAHLMYQLCYIPHGIANGGYAIAHSQIDDKDPLRFFVTRDQLLIINPVIFNHTKVPVDNLEGCLTCADRNPITVKRFHKIQVRFQSLMNVEEDEKSKMVLSPMVETDLSGPTAKIWEHEIAHTLGHCIYDAVISPDDCLPVVTN